MKLTVFTKCFGRGRSVSITIESSCLGKSKLFPTPPLETNKDLQRARPEPSQDSCLVMRAPAQPAHSSYLTAVRISSRVVGAGRAPRRAAADCLLNGQPKQGAIHVRDFLNRGQWAIAQAASLQGKGFTLPHPWRGGSLTATTLRNTGEGPLPCRGMTSLAGRC